MIVSKKTKGAELLAPPRLSLPIATVPVVASRVVRVAIVTTVVIRPPPAAIGPTNPTYLLDFRRRIGRDRRDRHRRSYVTVTPLQIAVAANKSVIFLMAFLHPRAFNARYCLEVSSEGWLSRLNIYSDWNQDARNDSSVLQTVGADIGGPNGLTHRSTHKRRQLITSPFCDAHPRSRRAPMQPSPLQ